MYWWPSNEDYRQQTYHRLEIIFSLMPIIKGQLTFSSWDVIFRYDWPRDVSWIRNTWFWKASHRNHAIFGGQKLSVAFFGVGHGKEQPRMAMAMAMALLWENCFCFLVVKPDLSSEVKRFPGGFLREALWLKLARLACLPFHIVPPLTHNPPVNQVTGSLLTVRRKKRRRTPRGWLFP